MTAKVNRKLFGDLVEILLEGGASKATKYLSSKLVVKAKKKASRARVNKITQIVLTVGVPNYEEREFIKKLNEAGERFPVKKIQIKWPK